MITLKSCEKMTLEEISKEIKRKVKLIEDGEDKVHNRLHLLARILPSL